MYKRQVLGSGLGDYAEQLEIRGTIDYHDIEGFPVSTVPGHKGRFVFARINEVPAEMCIRDSLGLGSLLGFGGLLGLGGFFGLGAFLGLAGFLIRARTFGAAAVSAVGAV